MSPTINKPANENPLLKNRGKFAKPDKSFVNEYGEILYMENGVLHRDNDLPAAIYPNGTKVWYRNGKMHRDGDKPAQTNPNGTQHWYQNGVLHRNGDKPASVWGDGCQEWYQNGQLHRDNDQPAVIDNDGLKRWYQNGLQHREGDKPAVKGPWVTAYYKNGKCHRESSNDLPAVIHANGTQEWYQNGQLHRGNGKPAIIYRNNEVEYWIHGKKRNLYSKLQNKKTHVLTVAFCLILILTIVLSPNTETILSSVSMITTLFGFYYFKLNTKKEIKPNR